MGFLDKLWDETLAGPAPETGLGKLRKYDSFHLPSSTATCTLSPTSHHHHQNDHIAVTRSISIIRTTSNLSDDPGSPPATPRTPMSPGTPRADFKRLMRRKSSAEALESAESRRRL